ncbi:alkene reductase [Aeromicrobium ginsengisoli]|uniref:Alkene reductase n=1 Tax=Aeromicrobium ginsengisoli TaxID=363867 RepID=A0A5M4FET9_9ACTN|nr:alkene reductase [Aeromicrobium ginsengisoli]KAA1397804.1 alkene reductase [Aeromicrobium ginsengisoli]
MSIAFKPVTVGPWDLPQSFVMAPMTRSRAGAGNVPTALNSEYYAQRASAGLLITEGIAPSEVGQGYPFAPGLYTDAQVEGWRAAAEAVHAAGGTIVAQLMHVGRVAHTDNKAGAETIAPSAVQAPGEMFTPTGPQPHDVPRAARADELDGIRDEYVVAARNAMRAGLDGVEVHAANGYLLHQFLDPTVNLRDDEYGGTPQRRARFVVEVVAAIADAIGAERVGVRLAPGNPLNGMGEQPGEDLVDTYRAVVDGISNVGLAYLSVLVVSQEHFGPLVADLRERFDGPLMLNAPSAEPTSLETVENLLGDGLADVVAVGRSFLANPDLVERWKQGAPVNEADPATFYGGDHRGYTDYPVLAAV